MVYTVCRRNTEVLVGGSVKTCVPESDQGNISDQLI